ncbi:MAG TPA: enoyl-CoA hydratase-related protein [Longimicrobiales bacterium]|nr:enoyl-CoA hydratase-related protein [Longimicrobiales bacterium]
MSERLTCTIAEGIARLTLNRPEKRNALDGETVAALHRAIDDVERDAGVRVIAVQGAGADFCAGADLAQLERIAEGAGVLENLDDATALGELFIRMRRARQPIVALVHGNAIAGGAGLATACDVILAREDAVFGYPEVQLGFVPAMVMALLRRSLGEKRAFELVARGERITARHAHDLGLVNHVYPRSSFEEEAHAYLRGFAARSASAIRLTKRLLYGMDGLSFEEAIARGAEVNVLARNTEDCRQGVRDFLARRKS